MIALLVHRAHIPSKARQLRQVLAVLVVLVPFPVFLAPVAAFHVLLDDTHQSSVDHCARLVKLALQDLILHRLEQLRSKLVCSVLLERIRA